MVKEKVFSQWSEKEYSLLIEGLRKYGKNYSKVAEIIGTRNREACIYKSKLHLDKIRSDPSLYGADLLEILMPDKLNVAWTEYEHA